MATPAAVASRLPTRGRAVGLRQVDGSAQDSRAGGGTRRAPSAPAPVRTRLCHRVNDAETPSRPTASRERSWPREQVRRASPPFDASLTAGDRLARGYTARSV